jgi:hypothetical protein
MWLCNSKWLTVKQRGSERVPMWHIRVEGLFKITNTWVSVSKTTRSYLLKPHKVCGILNVQNWTVHLKCVNDEKSRYETATSEDRCIALLQAIRLLWSQEQKWDTNNLYLAEPSRSWYSVSWSGASSPYITAGMFNRVLTTARYWP